MFFPTDMKKSIWYFVSSIWYKIRGIFEFHTKYEILNTKYSKGMTIIELLVYTGILLLLSAVAVGTLLRVDLAYRTFQSENSIESSSQAAMERMVREIRGSTGIWVASS